MPKSKYQTKFKCEAQRPNVKVQVPNLYIIFSIDPKNSEDKKNWQCKKQTRYQGPYFPLLLEIVSQWNVWGERQSGSKALERGSLKYGRPSLAQNQAFDTVGDSESKRLKVAALNLFHPTASLLSRIAVFSYCDTVSRGEDKGEAPTGEHDIFKWPLMKNCLIFDELCVNLNEVSQYQISSTKHQIIPKFRWPRIRASAPLSVFWLSIYSVIWVYLNFGICHLDGIDLEMWSHRLVA